MKALVISLEEMHLVTVAPVQCFSAPRHQILTKSAPQKAHNRNKAELATKVRKSS